MDAESFMARYGARLVANGYSVLPIQPGTKKPGQFRHGAWADYPAWTRHAERATTDLEVSIWSTWPDAGVGIACGAVAAIDIDIADDPDLALELERLCRTRLGDTPALRIGRAPKRLLVYRTLAPFRGIRRAPLEVLGLGQQFVAHALHPVTGRPYDWPEETLADLDIASLPVIDEASARAFLDEALALVPARLRPASLGHDTGLTVGQGLGQTGTHPAIRSALAFIPNADLDYDSWVRVGLALKGALGDEGSDLFAAWSAQSGKHDPAFTATTWGGLKAARIGAGTIYHLAMERGWKPDAGLVLDGAVLDEDGHPAASLLAKLAPRAENEEATSEAYDASDPLPVFELTIPDGLVGDLTRYMVETARRPQPLLSLGASLCAVGALMGRKYRTESNLRSNLYVVGIADSGSGKNHAREVINELFVEAGRLRYLGGNKIASGAGLLTAVHRQPAILFQIDEFGMFLSAAADRRRSPRHITDILDTMTELYTSASTLYLGAEYANRDGMNERRDINQPCLCLYGTTTPHHFWTALQGSNVVDGSLARFIILPTDDDYPEENMASGIRTIPTELLQAVNRVADGGGGIDPPGNLVGRTAGPETAVQPRVVPMSSAARSAFDELANAITTALRAARGSPHTAILARIAENAQKVALIVAVGRNPDHPEISGDDADWAISFIRHFAKQTIDAVERHVGDNEIDRSHKRVLDLIRQAGRGGIRKNDLTRKTQFLEMRRRDEILSALIEAGQVTLSQQRTTTRAAAVYRATGR